MGHPAEEEIADPDEEYALEKLMRLLAVSVHYLSTTFQKEAEDAGFERDKCTLLDLLKPVIQAKGLEERCPMDGKVGSSYVHSLMENSADAFPNDNLGMAQFCLSYTSKYKLGHVIDALMDFCDMHGQDPKRTYIWMYCLNSNTHRSIYNADVEIAAAQAELAKEKAEEDFFAATSGTVTIVNAQTGKHYPPPKPPEIGQRSAAKNAAAEQEAAAALAATASTMAELSQLEIEGDIDEEVYRELLENEFWFMKQRLDNIGHLLILLSPWNKPLALEEAWCHFEVYTAAELKTEAEEHNAQIMEDMIDNNNIEDDPTALFKTGCEISIIMPPSDKMNLEQNILGEYDVVNDLYKLIGSNKVQTTTSSISKDARAIIDKADKELGGFPIFNLKLNGVTRKWFRQITVEVMELRELCRLDNTDVLSAHYVDYFYHLAKLFDNSEEPEAALEMRDRAAKIQKTIDGVKSLDHNTITGDTSDDIKKEKEDKDDNDDGDNGDNGDNEDDEMDAELAAELAEAMAELEAEAKKDADIGGNDKKTDLKERHFLAYHNIARVLAARDDHDGALLAYGKAMLIQEQIFGKVHPSTGKVYSDIAVVLRSKGEIKGTAIAYIRALDSMVTSIGEEHPMTATTHLKLGFTYEELDNFEKAAAEYAKGQEIIGLDHPKLTEPYEIKENQLRKKKDLDGALREFQKGCIVREMVMREDTTAEAALLTSEGRELVKEGDLDGALLEYSKALDLKIQSLGPNDPEIALARNHIGALLLDKKDTEGALVQFKAVLKIYKFLNKGEHEQDMATAHNNVGVLLKDKEEFAEALEHLQAALEIRELTLGENNLATATTLFYIGEIQEEQEKYEESMATLRRAYDIFKRSLGKENQRTQKVRESIEIVKIHLKRIKREERRAQRLEEKEEEKEPGGCCDQIKEFLKSMLEG